VIDSFVLPETPYDAFAAGHAANVPLLLGANADEARALADVANVKASTFEADIGKAFGPLPPQLLAAYPHATDAEARRSRLDFEGDLRFRWDMWTWARLHAEHAQHAVYFYRFDHAPPFPSVSPRAGWGASHFAELWYVFDHLGQESWAWTASDHRMAQTIASYWTNFVKNGDPNGPGLPAWPRFASPDGPAQVLADPIATKDVADRDRLQLFDTVYTALRKVPLK
jgi:para-nitrobenzyl esterase